MFVVPGVVCDSSDEVWVVHLAQHFQCFNLSHNSFKEVELVFGNIKFLDFLDSDCWVAVGRIIETLHRFSNKFYEEV